MPMKPKQVKLLDLVPAEMIENLVVESCNITTSSKSSYEVLSSKILSPNENQVSTRYGTGPLSYKGFSNEAGTLIAAESESPDKTNYLVRAVGKQALKKLEGVVSNHSSSLTDCKVSNSQAIAGLEIPNGIDAGTLISNAMQNQQNLGKKRLKVAMTPSGIFEIGTRISNKHIQVSLSRKEGTPSRSCLCVTSVVKETKSNFFPTLDKQNLILSDIHALSIREAFEALNDCDLKLSMIDFIKKTFSLPSKDKLKAKKINNLPSKVKYLQSALNASIKYLEDAELKDSARIVMISYLNQLSNKGFSTVDALTSISNIGDSTTGDVSLQGVEPAAAEKKKRRSTGKASKGEGGGE